MNPEDKDLPVTENADGSVSIGAPEPSDSGSAQDDDSRIRNEATDNETEADDPAAAGITEEEKAKRERRRQERQAKKQRIRDRDDHMRAELAARDRLIDDMRRRLDEVDKRSVGGDLAALDERIRREDADVTYLKSVIADGTAAQNGAAVAEATLQLTQKMADIRALTEYKRRATARVNAAPQPQADPRMVVNAAAWMKDNSWYDPTNARSDPDTRRVLEIDQRLADEGYNPASPTYWDELSARVARELPHRAGQSRQDSGGPGYNAGTSQSRQSRSPVAGSGSDGSSAQGGRSKGSFTLSAERVTAMKEAGMWDDPKARANAIRGYQEYDARSSTQR